MNNENGTIFALSSRIRAVFWEAQLRLFEAAEETAYR